MISLKGPIDYSKSTIYTFIDEDQLCPHCGGKVNHNPNDTFDMINHTIVIPSKRVEGVKWIRRCPPKSWNVLMLLLDNIGKFLSTERIHAACFDYAVDNGIVTVTIGAIRKNLQGSPYFIETHYGVGYRLLRQ